MATRCAPALNKPFINAWIALTVMYYLVGWLSLSHQSGYGLLYYLQPYYIVTCLLLSGIQAVIVHFTLTHISGLQKVRQVSGNLIGEMT